MMHELGGVSRHAGVAMAVGVVVDSDRGFAGITENVMMTGIKALRSGLPEAEWQEVVIVCDVLAIGSNVMIPGSRIIGIACESDDEPLQPLSVPCMTGVAGLVSSVGPESMVIVDADSGRVIIDPDIYSVIDYQDNSETDSRAPITFDADDLPTFTSDGRVITVSAVVSSLDDAELAISQGADSLTVYLDEVIENDGRMGEADAEVEAVEMVAAMAVSKPLVFVCPSPDDELLQLAARLSDNGGISFVEPELAPQPVRVESIGKSVSAGEDLIVVMPADVAAAKAALRVADSHGG